MAQPPHVVSCADSATPSDWPFRSLVETAGAIRSGEVSPLALTEHMLERIAALDGRFHSYLHVMGDAAREAARQAAEDIGQGRYRGPLHGVPIAVKDLFDVQGVPTSFGMAAKHHVVPAQDAMVVARLKQAGAVILGKLHLHEGAYGGHHPSLPRPVNPWHADYWPGGSSSGSGVATAAGLCFASLGSDTGGSIRLPCHACGLTGVKPTSGRVSRHGALPLAETLDTVGPMARSAADCAAVLGAIAGRDSVDPTTLAEPVPDYLAALGGIDGARGLRVGVDWRFVEDGTDAEVATAVRGLGVLLVELGATLHEVTVPDVDAVVRAQVAICGAEAALVHEAAFRADPASFGPGLGGLIEEGLALSPTVYAAHTIERARFSGRLARLFDDIDILLCPVMPFLGLRYDQMGGALDGIERFVRHSAPFNMTGSPSLTLPVGRARNGLPIGAQMVGRPLSEAMLLRAAHAVQQATDWHRARPPLA